METQTETKASTPVLEQPTPAPIIPSRPAGTFITPWQAVEWNTERIELARKTYAKTATKEEFEFFIEWCRQTGLNPFLKQAYLVPRRAQVNGAWVDVHEPMAAEAGMAARADSLPDFRGMKSGVVYLGDTFGVNEVTQEIIHEWTIAERKKAGDKVIGAWAHGFRDGRVTEITYVTLESRVGLTKEKQPTQFWARDPAGQLRKCARADQYRRLYPAIFNGVYVEGEVHDEYEVNAAPVPTITNPTGKTDALRERLKKAGSTTVDAKPADAKKPAEAKGSTAPPIDCVRFGPFKGTLIKDVGSVDLEAAIEEANRGLANATGKEPWVKTVKEGITAIVDELQRRENAPVPEAEQVPDENQNPEPGSGG